MRAATAAASRAAGDSVRSIAEQVGVHLRTAHLHVAARTCSGRGGPALFGEYCQQANPDTLDEEVPAA